MDIKLPRYAIHDDGLELPVYDETTQVAYGKNEIIGLSARSDTSFVRNAKIGSGLGLHSLRALLVAADEEFTAVANDCGARLPLHHWGLYKQLQDRPEQDHPLLPSGYVLVAEVEIIHDTYPLTTVETAAIEAQLEPYPTYGSRPAVWDHAKAFQFINGRSQRDSITSRYLIDIEPIMERRVPLNCLLPSRPFPSDLNI